MKILAIILFCVTTAFGGTAWNTYESDHTRNTVSGIHYDQHTASVSAARKSVEERLANLGSSSDYRYEGSCSSCSSNVGGVGVGYVGFAGGRDSRYHSEQHLQNARPVYVRPSSSDSSSYSENYHTASQIQNKPILIPVGGSAETFSEQSEHLLESRQLPNVAVVGSVPTESEKYSQHSEHMERSHSAPVPIYTQPSSASERFSSRSEHVSERRMPVPVPLYTPHSNSERYSAHQLSEQQSRNNYPVYVPAYNPSTSERFASHSERHSETKSAPVVPVPVYSPSGRREQYNSYSERVSQTRPVPVPVYTSGGTQRYSSRDERISESRTTPILTPVVAPSTLSASRHSEHESSRSRSGTYYPVMPVPGNGLFSTESRFGSARADSQHTIGDSSSLASYMSESERLAKLQAQNIHHGDVRSSSGIHDANASSSSNLATTGTADIGAGGFRKSQSWEKTSKWASGTEFGTDGKPKNYNMLSTAESEQHNINGNQAGYKAATTTLDDDGKVSTYSIHTP